MGHQGAGGEDFIKFFDSSVGGCQDSEMIGWSGLAGLCIFKFLLAYLGGNSPVSFTQPEGVPQAGMKCHNMQINFWTAP